MAKTLDEIHEDAPSLSLTPSQEEYDAWFNYYTSQTREATGDEENELYFVDVNDAVMNYITLCTLVKRYPELSEPASKIVDDVVRNAMGAGGGMVGGVNFIIEQLDRLDLHEEAMKTMFHDIFAQT